MLPSSHEPKCTHGIKKRSLPVEMVAPLDVNLIGRLAYNIPPARILLPNEGQRVLNILLVPILNS
jgi:hypothetical protein